MIFIIKNMILTKMRYKTFDQEFLIKVEVFKI